MLARQVRRDAAHGARLMGKAPAFAAAGAAVRVRDLRIAPHPEQD